MRGRVLCLTPKVSHIKAQRKSSICGVSTSVTSSHLGGSSRPLSQQWGDLPAVSAKWGEVAENACKRLNSVRQQHGKCSVLGRHVSHGGVRCEPGSRRPPCLGSQFSEQIVKNAWAGEEDWCGWHLEYRCSSFVFEQSIFKREGLVLRFLTWKRKITSGPVTLSKQ